MELDREELAARFFVALMQNERALDMVESAGESEEEKARLTTYAQQIAGSCVGLADIFRGVVASIPDPLAPPAT